MNRREKITLLKTIIENRNIPISDYENIKQLIDNSGLTYNYYNIDDQDNDRIKKHMYTIILWDVFRNNDISYELRDSILLLIPQ